MLNNLKRVTKKFVALFSIRLLTLGRRKKDKNT